MIDEERERAAAALFSGDQQSEINVRQDAFFHQWALDTTTLVSEFEHNLRGDRWVVKPTQVGDELINVGEWKLTDKPRMKEEAIKEIVNIIKIYVNPVTMLTNLDEDRILLHLENLRFEIAAWVLFNGRKNEIDVNERNLLIEEIIRFVEYALRKSKDAGERKAMTKAQSVQTRVVTPERRKKRFGIL